MGKDTLIWGACAALRARGVCWIQKGQRLTVEGKITVRWELKGLGGEQNGAHIRVPQAMAALMEKPSYFQPSLKQCLANKALCSGEFPSRGVWEEGR